MMCRGDPAGRPYLILLLSLRVLPADKSSTARREADEAIRFTHLQLKPF